LYYYHPPTARLSWGAGKSRAQFNNSFSRLFTFHFSRCVYWLQPKNHLDLVRPHRLWIIFEKHLKLLRCKCGPNHPMTLWEISIPDFPINLRNQPNGHSYPTPMSTKGNQNSALLLSSAAIKIQVGQERETRYPASFPGKR